MLEIRVVMVKTLSPSYAVLPINSLTLTLPIETSSNNLHTIPVQQTTIGSFCRVASFKTYYKTMPWCKKDF